MNTAVLVDNMGNDLRVVNSARVSFAAESMFATSDYSPDRANKRYLEWVTYTDNLSEGTEVLTLEDYGLIQYLSTHGHWTPFSHPMITFRETVPIFVARQRFKHMVGFTYNEVSRRYVDDTPEFYIPDVWRTRPDGSIKQGSGDAHQDTGIWSIAYEHLIEHAEKLYTDMIQAGVAPEQARMVLPQSMLTSYYVTGSLAAFARAYKQRVDPHAQKEITDLAKQWGEQIAPLYPASWAALTKGVS